MCHHLFPGLLGVLFVDKKEAVFSTYKMTQAASAFMLFVTGPYLCTSTKVGLGFLAAEPLSLPFDRCYRETLLIRMASYCFYLRCVFVGCVFAFTSAYARHAVAVNVINFSSPKSSFANSWFCPKSYKDSWHFVGPSDGRSALSFYLQVIVLMVVASLAIVGYVVLKIRLHLARSSSLHLQKSILSVNVPKSKS